MTELLDKALREIEKLAPEDQDEVAGVMIQMIELRQAGSILTDDQLAELQRRLADPNPVLIPMEDAFARLDRLWQDR